MSEMKHNHKWRKTGNSVIVGGIVRFEWCRRCGALKITTYTAAGIDKVVVMPNTSSW